MTLGRRSSAWLVAFTSGAVLTLEIVSLRLVAPYIGLTLETSTAVIGFALAAIAAGAALGGKIADHIDPARLLGPTVLVSGVLVALVGPLVRWLAGLVPEGDVATVLAVAAIAVFPPAALLSAVTPMVVKIRLGSLSETGSVVGSMSGYATLGALVATFVTGFVLVAAVPTSVILLTLAAALVVVGAASLAMLRRSGGASSAVALVIVGAVGALAPAPPCDVETAYHCARIVVDPSRPTGRLLQLDTLSHSYVDLADPEHLEFAYIRGIAAIVDELAPEEDIRALHLGGGGLTFPRYLQATRGAARNQVYEIDRGVVSLDEERLGARPDEELAVAVRDARVGLASEPSDSRDVVIGDAFAGLSVPWHLTTREAVADVRRVLSDDGFYVVNLIDYPPLGFVRAETATIRDVFPHVGVVARPGILDRSGDGGNVLVVGSERPLPEEALRLAVDEAAPELDIVVEENAVAGFVAGADVLTDDHAPVDQLLTPYPER